MHEETMGQTVHTAGIKEEGFSSFSFRASRRKALVNT
jgi:hypothetical protein